MGKTETRCCVALGTPGILPQPKLMLSGWMSPLQEHWGWCQRGAWHHPLPPALPQGTAWLLAPLPEYSRDTLLPLAFFFFFFNTQVKK